MNKPNLSFINDMQWIAEREQCWKVIEDNLKTDFRSKDLKCIHHYFMTGEQIDGYRLSDGALLQYYPLVNPEGWNFVLENLIVNSSIFEHDFYYSVYGNYIGFGTLEEKLRYFDFYHSNSFQSIVKSSVPVAGEGYVKLHVDFHKLFCFFASSYTRFLDDDEEAFCIHRSNYFFDLLRHITNDEASEERSRAYRLLKRIMKHASKSQTSLKMNYSEKKLEFLNKFLRMLNMMELDSSVKAMWNEVNKNQGAV